MICLAIFQFYLINNELTENTYANYFFIHSKRFKLIFKFVLFRKTIYKNLFLLSNKDNE